MNNRLKEIDLIVEQFFPQKNYENEKIDKINKFKLKYKDELKNYNIINTKEELYNLKSAGYIRYFDREDNLKFGGILLKVFESENENVDMVRTLILLKNSENIKWTISWENNMIFYKKQTKKGDNLRNLFISLLDTNIDDL
jgi:hypothetical protein